MVREQCTVCGRLKATFHYQGFVCHSCRVFFVRCIKRNVELVCRYGNDLCKVTPEFRANCASCRFKKCLKMNMQISDVGKAVNVRRAVVPYLSKSTTSIYIRDIEQSYGPIGCKIVSSLNGLSLPTFLQHMIHFERKITNLESTLPTRRQINANITLGELLADPERCAPRSTAAWYTRLAKKSNSNYGLIHMYARMCACFADFFSSINEFHELSCLDKVKMAQYHIGHLGGLDSVVYQYQYGLETAKDIDQMDNYSLSPYEISIWKEQCTLATNTFKTIGSIFHQYKTTHEEIMLLKLIIIFNPPINISEEGRQICSRARAKYQSLLVQLICQMYPQLNQIERNTRIGKMVNIFQHLRVYFKKAI